jgi:UDP-2,3-diacylglucosamine hydrolase
MNQEYLFISDCHLDQSRPEVTAALVEFLEKRAPGARYLYILGDFFEAWLGDDTPIPEFQIVVSSLQQLAPDTEIFFMAGNRDFLLGDEFARKVNFKLLEEPHIVQLGDKRVALIHGDTLCTDDHDYQAFRALVRDPHWQSVLLAKPLQERLQIARQLRSDSADAMAQKSLEIMDVNAQAVQDCFDQNQVDTIIHGHTHRPALHQYDSNLTRIVLGDWGRESSYLSWTLQQGFNLVDPRV